MILLIVGIVAVLTGGILLYLQQRSFHATALRLRLVEQDLVELRVDLAVAVHEMEGLVRFFNSLPPESSIKAGLDEMYHMRLPDRMKLDVS